MRRLVCIDFFTSSPANRSLAQTNLAVATDGSGQFKTVQEVIMAAPSGSRTNPVVIHVKAGTYQELIYIQHEKRFLHLVRADPKKTVLTYDLCANLPGPDGKAIGTFRTPSTTIDADDFTAEHLTYQNSAGPKGQALAVRVDGDRAAFRNCRFLGWQDTMLLNRLNANQPNAHFNPGNALAIQQRYEEAIVHFAECLRLSPNYAPAHKNLGMTLSRLGRREEAISHLNEAIRLKPDYEEAIQQLRALGAQKKE
ncbi:MAG: pectinesterase family protein [Verrucomicrobiota bacterium]